MAEQISHNVVDQPQSTSGFASQVDAAANYTISDAAGNGNHSINATNTDSLSSKDSFVSSKAQNTHANEANAARDAERVGNPAEQFGAKPSAGDAISALADPSLPNFKQSMETVPETSKSSEAHLLNGAHDTPLSVDDAPSLDVSADPSVASDTDTSRADVSEQHKDGVQHTRTNSVKKPPIFSRVSVTKNFLAKSVTPTPPVTKLGDKTGPASSVATLIAKPRLVAKSASSLSNISRVRNGAETVAGPDASKVWNKNRPAPPVAPKQFTDEELKQQYGIHLATRLQSDENGKESKWADIDDDEDDWAPETVVWMDGTKSTLTPAEAVPAPKEQKAETSAPPKPVEAVKPTLIATKKPIELSGPAKTILKPGAAAQAKQNGPTSPSPTSDKITLKAKSPAPVPTKSPWAALPPVEKISPINPPVQAYQPPQAASFASQDARAYEPASGAIPTREIAADTFDRSWREGEGERRELFNSANGRYEPAPEGRRSSAKPDSFARKPSVLQRPLFDNGPAEPSAAFQTRSSGLDGPGTWARRRGSSVSQGSQPPMRRMSINRGPEFPPALEEDQTSSVVGHETHESPSAAINEPSQPRFSQQTAWAQQLPPLPPVEQEGEDPVKAQERIMREKREAARRRRVEEEEREEAAKKERLEAKLAALGSAGQSRKERQQAAAAAKETPNAHKEADLPTPLVSPQMAQAETVPTDMQKPSTNDAQILQAQAPKPVMSGGALHPTEPVPERLDVPEPIPKAQEATSNPRQAAQADQSQRPSQREHLSPSLTSRSTFQTQTASPYRTAQSSAFSSPGDRDRKPQPFGRSPIANNDTFSPWPSAGPTGNVWGTSGIGNGTFESSSSFAPMPMSQQHSSLPPPPGMVRPSTSTRISPQGLGQEARSPSLQQAQLPEQQRAFASPGMESRTDHFIKPPRGNGISPSPGMGRQQHVPGPIAPPSRAQQAGRTDGVSAWQAAAQRLPSQYATEAEAAEKLRLEEASPVKTRKHDTFKETFKQTSVEQGRLGGPRKFGKTEYTIHDAQGSRAMSDALNPAPPNAQSQPTGPVPSSGLSETLMSGSGSAVRIPDGSLNPAHGGSHAQQPPIGPPASAALPPYLRARHLVASSTGGKLSNDKSPPPPETTSHPVYETETYRPHVRLPPPPPVVKLPPSASSAPLQTSTGGMMPQRPIQAWGQFGAQRPIVMNEAWQARFNGLFNRTPIQTETPPSPPKTPPKSQGPALAISSTSRAFWDEQVAVSGATVFLPKTQHDRKQTSPEGFTFDNSSETTSKKTMQHIFNDELGFGSRPLVRIPRNVKYEKYDNFADVHVQDMRQSGKDFTPHNVRVQSRPDLPIFHLFYKKPEGVYVKLPGALRNKLIFERRASRGTSGKALKHKSGTAATAKHVHAPQPPVSAVPSGGPTSKKANAPPKSTPSASTANASSPPMNNNRKKSGLGKVAKSGSRNPTPVKSN